MSVSQSRLRCNLSLLRLRLSSWDIGSSLFAAISLDPRWTNLSEFSPLLSAIFLTPPNSKFMPRGFVFVGTGDHSLFFSSFSSSSSSRARVDLLNCGSLRLDSSPRISSSQIVPPHPSFSPFPSKHSLLSQRSMWSKSLLLAVSIFLILGSQDHPLCHSSLSTLPSRSFSNTSYFLLAASLRSKKVSRTSYNFSNLSERVLSLHSLYSLRFVRFIFDRCSRWAKRASSRCMSAFQIKEREVPRRRAKIRVRSGFIFGSSVGVVWSSFHSRSVLRVFVVAFGSRRNSG
mmetsp:Transcript_6238/g.15524  ORF Transcript_6238/g.15524 Transcript_6238/m.15524 type:complete len:287 (-) Transcript_6238:875-1735(-)